MDVERSALKLLEQSSDSWDLKRPDCSRLLSWAALLHEIGLVIAHDGSHRHGEYMLRHAELFGFSQTDQRQLAALVRLQRGKFAQSALEDLPASWQQPMRRLAMLFRLAVLLHRSRAPGLRIPLKIEATAKIVKLDFRAGWLDKHPLTREDLDLEAEYLAATGVRLRF
jgi:exopolyphosphatase/guanosine-5'-triphosphate,3'-diphosphate pyrophosphatase